MPRPCCSHPSIRPTPSIATSLFPFPLLLALLLSACASKPRNTTAAASGGRTVLERAGAHGLVDIHAYLPDVVCDLRYGTRQNVTGQALYPPGMPCLLLAATAEKLARAQNILRPQGFGLKIWDAWRPPEVQRALYRYGQKTGKADLFVNPDEAWSYHCSGTAVDVTLVDSQGREMPLPTYHDESGPQAHSMTAIPDQRILRNIQVLQEAMLKSGFEMIDLEWWHFDDAALKSEESYSPAVFAGEIGLTLPALK